MRLMKHATAASSLQKWTLLLDRAGLGGQLTFSMTDGYIRVVYSAWGHAVFVQGPFCRVLPVCSTFIGLLQSLLILAWNYMYLVFGPPSSQLSCMLFDIRWTNRCLVILDRLFGHTGPGPQAGETWVFSHPVATLWSCV